MKTGLNSSGPAMILLLCLALILIPSCMKEKPEALPEEFVWNPELAFPLGEEAFGLNAESGFDITLLETDSISGLPGWVGESELTMEGILKSDLSVIAENLDRLKQILFRVNSYNQFPHTVHSQAYFLNDSQEIIDSMFVAGPVDTPPGRISKDGDSIESGYARHDAIIEEERIQGLIHIHSILFRSSFQFPDLDSALIPIYHTLSFEIDVGMMLDLSFEY